MTRLVPDDRTAHLVPRVINECVHAVCRETTNYPVLPAEVPAWLWSIRSRSRAAVSHGEPSAADPKNLITYIDVDNPAVQDQEGERLFDDAGKESELLRKKKPATLS